MYRLKFQVGEFYCYSTFITPNNYKEPVPLHEDVDIDLNENSIIKIALVGVNGRTRGPHVLNEIAFEEVLSHVLIRVKDYYPNSQSSSAVHRIAFTDTFYDADLQADPQHQAILICTV
jgi:hypothetical protein